MAIPTSTSVPSQSHSSPPAQSDANISEGIPAGSAVSASPSDPTRTASVASAPPSQAAGASGVPARFRLNAANDLSSDESRRPSVQFQLGRVANLLRSEPRGDARQDSARESPKSAAAPAGKPRSLRRLSSPPPPSHYESRVSFDTFDNKDAAEFSLTLKTKHRDYQYTRRSRTFLCGTDQNDYSEFALEWLLDELVEDGDEVVCLRVVSSDSKLASDRSMGTGEYRRAAHKLMEHIHSKIKEDGCSIILTLEFAVGKIHEIIQRTIATYEPACLIVGTRGRSLSGLQGLLPGSVSKYCLQNSPVPVIVVRPSDKREKKKKKRLADPMRRAYIDLMTNDPSGTSTPVAPGTGHPVLHQDMLTPVHANYGGSNLMVAPTGTIGGNEPSGDYPGAETAEAEAVARAIGLPDRYAANKVLRGEARAYSPAPSGASIPVSNASGMSGVSSGAGSAAMDEGSEGRALRNRHSRHTSSDAESTSPSLDGRVSVDSDADGDGDADDESNDDHYDDDDERRGD